MSARAEAEAIFDAFAKLGRLTALAQRRRDKLDQIRSVTERRCGNCRLWMTSDCVPEKQHKQFKSMNSMACGAFSTDAGSARLLVKFREELSLIDGEITAQGKTGGQS